ncbi:copper-binding protein [Roseibium alexandrii]|uniref:Copper binding periplasmic protein CusF n=1 Tax=Roseibium alexandrii TaxID=388408 RepID=A0A0M7A5I4_9HYPH|nr:copper-binding protein [Roseibium alexandrii]CTQ69686.1 Copper binding periplasmic protein CusF [Roseibium alexandrii]
MKSFPITASTAFAGLLMLLTLTSADAVVDTPQASFEMDHASLEIAGAQIVGALHLEGVINAMSEDVINISHEANDRIGWPAMKMDLPLAPYAKIMPGIRPGASVTLMLTLGKTGSYRIAAIVPGSPEKISNAKSDDPMGIEKSPC